jgi:hypothetical protein
MPIGNAIRWQVVNRNGSSYTGPALELLDLFVTNDESEEADSVFRLVSAGVMRSSSVGFYPKKITVVSDENERQRLGLGRWGVIFEESLLVEHSPVAVPANVGATVIQNFAKSAIVRDRDVDVIRESMRVDAITRGISRATWARLDATVRSIWRARFAEFRTEASPIDKPIETIGRATPVVAVPKGETTPEIVPPATMDEVLGEIRALRQDFDSLAERIESRSDSGSDRGTTDESSAEDRGTPNDALSLILARATDQIDAHTNAPN